MTYSPLLIFWFFFLFSVYIFDDILKLNLRWGVKKTLIEEKKASSSIYNFLDSGYYLFNSLFCLNILISFLSFFNNYFPLFFLKWLFHILPMLIHFLFLIRSSIPSYSYTRFNSILYSIFPLIRIHVYNKIDDCFIISGRHIRPLRLLLGLW